MKHLKKNIISNISSDNNIVSKNSKNYADFGQKNKPTGLTGKKNRLFKSLGIGAMAVFLICVPLISINFNDSVPISIPSKVLAIVSPQFLLE